MCEIVAAYCAQSRVLLTSLALNRITFGNPTLQQPLRHERNRERVDYLNDRPRLQVSTQRVKPSLQTVLARETDRRPESRKSIFHRRCTASDEGRPHQALKAFDAPINRSDGIEYEGRTHIKDVNQKKTSLRRDSGSAIGCLLVFSFSPLLFVFFFLFLSFQCTHREENEEFFLDKKTKKEGKQSGFQKRPWIHLPPRYHLQCIIVRRKEKKF